MDPLGLKPYGVGYVRLYNALLGIIVLCLTLCLLCFVAALASPHDTQVVEVNKAVFYWNEDDDRDYLKAFKFRAEVGEQQVELYWTDLESGNYSEEVAQMSDLTSYNASYFLFENASVTFNPPQLFTELTVPFPQAPQLHVLFEVAHNGTEFVPLSNMTDLNVSLWQEHIVELPCEDHCSEVCLAEGGVWRDKCYQYYVVDTVCIALAKHKTDWQFSHGCYAAQGTVRYRLMTPYATQTFAGVRFEVRSKKDPFLKAVEVTNDYGVFAASSVSAT
jgi:hypothetical protein